MTDLLHNLRAGARLVCMNRITASDFRVSADQLVLLASLNVLLALVCDYLVTPPPVEFWPDGFGFHGLWLALSLLLVHLGAREAPKRGSFVTTGVLFFSPFFLGWLFFLGIKVAAQSWGPLEWLALDTALAFLFVPFLWIIGNRALRVGCALPFSRSSPLVLIYVTAVSFSIYHIDRQLFWTDDWYENSAEFEEDDPAIDAEKIFYAQYSLVARATKQLLPGRPDVTDLYFVGFGADATQDVFMREIHYTQDLFDRRFDTAGRSVVMINNETTVDSVPIASSHNLDQVLSIVGARMNAEDVLFLFLTGHGARNHNLAIRFPGLPLNRIGPEQLARSIENAGIGWRVIVVSSCYSGGYIEELSDEKALVITASAGDRSSFGCSNEADFTYFGRAFFKLELAESRDFFSAFERARQRIHKWESDEDKKLSLPQIALAAPILEKLAELQERLDNGVISR